MPPKTQDPASQAAEALLKNPQFVEMFQRAVGDGNAMPEGEKKREAWLKDLQGKLHEETVKEAKKAAEEEHADEDGRWMWIAPEVGFCIKAHIKPGKAKKVFINICAHERIAEPVPIEDAGEADAIQFRIPLSCGAGRADKDKKGDPCVVYDVVVNPQTVKRCSEDSEFRRFVAALCMSWIRQKSEPNLDDEEFTNVNIRCKGKPQMQRIRLAAPQAGAGNAMGDEIKLPGQAGGATAPSRTAANPQGKMVMEIDPAAAKAPAPAAAAAPAGPRPEHSVKRLGDYDWSGHAAPARSPFFRDAPPATLEVSVTIPGISTIKEVDVRVEGREVRLIYVDSEDGHPFHAVPLPFPVATDPLAAKFVRKAGRLTLTLAVEIADEAAAAKARVAAASAAEAEEARQAAVAKAELEKRIAAQRAKAERLEAEEKAVMADRKALVEGLAAMQEGAIPPDLQKEIESMPPAQARGLMQRIEGRIRAGDSVDQLMDKLPAPLLHRITTSIRKRLGLEPLPAPEEPKKPAEAAAEAAADPGSGNVEYNFAAKAEGLFGVKMYNRYVFALDH